MKKTYICLLALLLCLTGCQAAPEQPTIEQPAPSQTVASKAGNMDEPEDTVTPTLEVTPLKDGLSTVGFEGDSGFDEFLEQGGADSDWEVAQYLTSLVKENISLGNLLFGCSTLSAANASGGCLFGRNFDWEPCNAMIVQSVPENGYKSISTVNTGRSVVVEYINNEMVVVETPVVANFYLAEGEKNGVGTAQSHERYDILMDALAAHDTMTTDEVRDTLDSVSKNNFGEFESTEWSVVFDLGNLIARYYHRENYAENYTFQLD